MFLINVQKILDDYSTNLFQGIVFSDKLVTYRFIFIHRKAEGVRGLEAEADCIGHFLYEYRLALS